MDGDLVGAVVLHVDGIIFEGATSVSKIGVGELTYTLSTKHLRVLTRCIKVEYNVTRYTESSNNRKQVTSNPARGESRFYPGSGVHSTSFNSATYSFFYVTGTTVKLPLNETPRVTPPIPPTLKMITGVISLMHSNESVE